MIYELTTVISSLCIHAAYFRKFAISIPDHHDKADIASKKEFTLANLVTSLNSQSLSEMEALCQLLITLAMWILH